LYGAVASDSGIQSTAELGKDTVEEHEEDQSKQHLRRIAMRKMEMEKALSA